MSAMLRSMGTIGFLVAFLAFPVSAQAAAPPVKLVFTSHIGWEVDKTTKGNVCTVESQDECQPEPGFESSQPGGFKYAEGVAGAPNGNFYVSDRGNHRVQELEASGKFVLMFGKEVNETKTIEFNEPGNPHGIADAEKNICTAVSGDVCRPGATGTSGSVLGGPQGIVVEPGTEDVYVQDWEDGRVDKYTAKGEFLWTATAEKCGFQFEAGPTNLVAIGGPSGNTIYVGDKQGIHKLSTSGECTGDIKLPSVTALAADATTLYVVYEFQSAIHELSAATGEPVKELEVAPRTPGGIIGVRSLALDQSGHLAVSGGEQVIQETPFGELYKASDSQLLTYFTVPGGLLRGLGFNGKGEMLGVFNFPPEVLHYVSVPVAEPLTLLGTCAVATVDESNANVMLDCELKGDVNPWSVPNTETWFEWGRTESLGSKTPVQVVCTAMCAGTPVEVSYIVKEVRPGEGSFYYRMRGYDDNVKPPEEALTSPLPPSSFPTPSVPPRVLGEPVPSFIKSSSVVLTGELNPESTSTTYEFQYAEAAACEEREKELEHSIAVEECPGMLETTELNSAGYGRIGATGEAANLRPSTKYRDRLYSVNELGERAVNEHGETSIPEGAFITGPVPSVGAQTGPPSMVTSTTAIVSGVVNPDGQPATYTFEVGVYAGAGTQYVAMFSGSVSPNSDAVLEERQLTGLRPDTTYVYRISIHYGDGTTSGSSATGVVETFTTLDLPAAVPSPTPLEMLSAPPFSFPKQERIVVKCRRGYKLGTHRKCMRSRKRRRGKGHRASRSHRSQKKGGAAR